MAVFPSGKFFSKLHWNVCILLYVDLVFAGALIHSANILYNMEISYTDSLDR